MNGNIVTPFPGTVGHEETQEQKDINACCALIDQALKAHACRLVFEQVTQNGVPTGGRFLVVKVQ